MASELGRGVCLAGLRAAVANWAGSGCWTAQLRARASSGPKMKKEKSFKFIIFQKLFLMSF
jgi:hypothetical protein